MLGTAAHASLMRLRTLELVSELLHFVDGFDMFCYVRPARATATISRACRSQKDCLRSYEKGRFVSKARLRRSVVGQTWL